MPFLTIHRRFTFLQALFQNRRLSSKLSVIAISTIFCAINAPGNAQAAALNLAVNSPAKYKLDVLRVGKMPYVDKSHKFTNIPAAYNGLCFLRTANSDNRVKKGKYVTLNASKPVTVFVGFDARMKTLPAWVKKWKKTGHTLGFKAAYRQKLTIYRKNFPAGKISLGGNEKGYKTYVIAVKDRDGSSPKTCKMNGKLAKNSTGTTPSKRLALKVSGGFKHQLDVTQNNKKAYIDKKFKLTAVPAAFKGMCYVRPTDSNSTQSNKRSLVLKSNKQVNVYVGFDSRIKSLPVWVNKSWKKTGKKIGLQANARRNMILYRKTFKAGNIVLGGNEVGFRHYITLVEDPQANGITSCKGSGGSNNGGTTPKSGNTTLTYSWQPSNGNVNGYRIYQGGTAGKVNRLVSVVRLNNKNFDPANPSMDFDAWKLLGQYAGKKTCFKVSAFNGSGESKKSPALCMKL